MKARPVHYIRYLWFYYNHRGDTSAAGQLLITECIIRPVVSVSWFIKYIYIGNLQF